jgi:SAM-dependent methyltransferase
MTTAEPAIPCPLCGSQSSHYHRDKRREYLQCALCKLVFVPPEFHLSHSAEKAEYDKHQNAANDTGYQRFLQRMAGPMIERIPAHSKGLDFGCGPAPVLAEILRSAGHRVAIYDVYYFPHQTALDGQYDFITATEVVEHLARPMLELERLWQLLAPGGTLGIMTKLVIDAERFTTWHYIRDPTHISFFSRDTLQWVAAQLNANIEFIGSDVVLLNKPQS